MGSLFKPKVVSKQKWQTIIGRLHAASAGMASGLAESNPVFAEELKDEAKRIQWTLLCAAAGIQFMMFDLTWRYRGKPEAEGKLCNLELAMDELNPEISNLFCELNAYMQPVIAGCRAPGSDKYSRGKKTCYHTGLWIFEEFFGRGPKNGEEKQIVESVGEYLQATAYRQASGL